MASPAARVFTISLAAVTTLAELIGRGNNPTRLTVQEVLPAGSLFRFIVRLDPQGDDIPIPDTGVLEIPGGSETGIWWRNDAAQAGITVTLLVGFDDPASSYHK